MKTALLFSGQGSQYVGMARDIAEQFPAALRLSALADQLVGFPLSTICFEGPEETLRETRYTQPALFLHSSMIMEVLSQKLEFDAVAGHSLGEYSALAAAGVLSFADALKVVKLRGELMFHAGEQMPGTMFAVIGLEDEAVNDVCQRLSGLGEGVAVPANYNSPGQIVVSGTASLLRNHSAEFKAAGAKMVKELSVSGAFHSPLMEPARATLEQAIQSAPFAQAQKQVYVNITGKPVELPAELKSAAIQQLTAPVLWTQTLKNMYEDGIKTFIEIGPGNVLQGLVKRTLPSDVVIKGIDKATSIEQYL